MKKTTAYVFYGSLATLFATYSVRADTHIENPDAGVTEATAQKVPRNVNFITGTLKPGTTDGFGVDPTDVDVFCFTLAAPVNGASIQVFADTFDSNLLLLREGFYGIWGDDDSGVGGADSGIITNLPAGTYYIAVGINNIGPYQAGDDDAGDYVWDNDSDELSPAEAALKIAFIGSEDGDPTSNQPYQIALNFLTSDDPATVALRTSLESKLKKAKKALKKAKKKDDSRKVKKLKKVLKRLKKRIAAL